MSDPLEKLYLEHKDSIYRFFFRSTLNDHRAEELTQETFLRAFKGINQFRGDSSLKTWLFKIARNTLLNDAKKKSNIMEQQTEPSAVELMTAKNEYKALDEQLLINQVLNLMEEKDRIFLILRDFQDFTYAEIAEILNVTEGQVKIGIYRARKKFKFFYQVQGEENRE